MQHSIAAIIAAIAKYELGAKPWPELLDLTNRCCVSAEVPQREVGMFLLSSIAADSTQILEPYFDHFLQLMVRMLQDRDSAVVRVHAFQYGGGAAARAHAQRLGNARCVPNGGPRTTPPALAVARLGTIAPQDTDGAD